MVSVAGDAEGYGLDNFLSERIPHVHTRELTRIARPQLSVYIFAIAISLNETALLR